MKTKLPANIHADWINLYGSPPPQPDPKTKPLSPEEMEHYKKQLDTECQQILGVPLSTQTSPKKGICACRTIILCSLGATAIISAIAVRQLQGHFF